MKKILIVDDVSLNIKCAKEVLKKDFEVLSAKSGKNALKMLEEIIPDLILLDISMPDMDGFEVVTRLQEAERTQNIPVIFLTGDSDYETEVKCLELGAVDYIRKPFEPNVFMSRINRALALTEEHL